MNDQHKMSFVQEERCLCFHGPMLYEAKIQKCEYWTDKPKEEENGPHYFIHYKGWKPSWDEWVPETRILKYNDENLKKQLDLKESHSARKTRIQKETKTSTNDDKKKRARDTIQDQEDEYVKKPAIQITIPETLKVQLVDDWENVTKNNKLVALPKTITVSHIIQQFKSYCTDFDSEMMQEVCEGLKVYFDKALSNILLYKFERKQFSDYAKKANASDIYGAEHLLRLFVQMPTIIAHTNMDADGINVLRDHFTEFLKFMDEKKDELFSQGYEDATPAYIGSK